MSDARGPHDSCPVSSQRLHKIIADMVDTLISLKVPKPLVDSSTQLEELRILAKWIHRYEEVPPTIPMPDETRECPVTPQECGQAANIIQFREPEIAVLLRTLQAWLEQSREQPAVPPSTHQLEDSIRFFHEGCGGILLGEIPGPYSCAECGKHIDLVCKVLGPERIQVPSSTATQLATERAAHAETKVELDEFVRHVTQDALFALWNDDPEQIYTAGRTGPVEVIQYFKKQRDAHAEELRSVEQERDALLGQPEAVHLGAQAAITALRQCQAVMKERDALRSFAQGVMRTSPGDDLDGADLQELAEKHGLLTPLRVAAPCNDTHCVCAEVGNLPGICYRKTALLTGPSEQAKG